MNANATIFIISPLIFIIGLLNIVLNRSRLLVSLLSLEVMILGLLTLFILANASWGGLSNSPTEIISLLILLTMGACEASLGLACLVLITRSHGNDHLGSLTSSNY